MRVQMHKAGNNGFAMIELLLVLVIIAGIVGVGAYVLKQKQNADSLTTSAANTTPAAGKTVAKLPANGTSASIDQLTQSEATSEVSASTNADNQTQQTAQSANTSVGNVGGAYNEATF